MIMKRRAYANFVLVMGYEMISGAGIDMRS